MTRHGVSSQHDMTKRLTIHDLHRAVYPIRPISSRTLYRWLEETGIGSGRAYYSEAEQDELKEKARRLNEIRSYTNYSNRFRTIGYEEIRAT